MLEADGAEEDLEAVEVTPPVLDEDRVEPVSEETVEVPEAEGGLAVPAGEVAVATLVGTGTGLEPPGIPDAGEDEGTPLELAGLPAPFGPVAPGAPGEPGVSVVTGPAGTREEMLVGSMGKS